MVKVYVNNVEVEVSPESTLKEAIERAGFKVPILCYLNGIFNEATCRVCVVDAGGRYVPACRFPVSDGMKIYTDTEAVRRYRRLNIELLLSMHRIKCWECMMKGGSCKLLELSKDYGVEGIPICAECPLYGDECLVMKGEPCLGPLTMAGCDAECVRKGLPCIGCRGPIKHKDVIEEALSYYCKGKVSPEKILSYMKMFWSADKSLVDEIMGLFGNEGVKS